MMMLLHVIMSFQLLVFMASTAFLIWALRTEGKGRWLALIVGVITFLCSLTSVVCTSFYSMKYWHGDSRSYMHRQYMMTPGMGNDDNRRMDKSMMQEGMPMNNQRQQMMQQRHQRLNQNNQPRKQNGPADHNQPSQQPNQTQNQ